MIPVAAAAIVGLIVCICWVIGLVVLGWRHPVLGLIVCAVSLGAAYFLPQDGLLGVLRFYLVGAPKAFLAFAPWAAVYWIVRGWKRVRGRRQEHRRV